MNPDIPVLDLPNDPQGWQELDEKLSLARSLVRRRMQEWRVAGGYSWGPDLISRPTEYSRLQEAREEYGRLSALTYSENESTIRNFSNRQSKYTEHDVDIVISWLESDPFGHETGYIKKDAMHRLARIDVTESQKVRLRLLLIRLLKRGNRAEFKEACYLARHVRNEEFEAQLTSTIQQSEKYFKPVHFAANLMLMTCRRPSLRK